MKVARAVFAPSPVSLYDTLIGRTPHTGHAIEGFGGDLGFGCLGLHFSAAQLNAD